MICKFRRCRHTPDECASGAAQKATEAKTRAATSLVAGDRPAALFV